MSNKYWEKWPKFIITREKYGTSYYLVNSMEEFNSIVCNTVLLWDKENVFGEEDWYTYDSYEDFFEQDMDMTVEEFEKNIKPLSNVNHHIKELQYRASEMPKNYEKNNYQLRAIKTVKKYVETGITKPRELYVILSELTINDEPRFTVRDFDTI